MNWFGFIRLLRTIYGKGLPDLDYIQKQGLLAVKIGQTYALRIDFLNEESCRHLARLYRRTDRLPPSDFDRLCVVHTGADWRNHFTSIDSQPLASASIGQVHRGRLKDGSDVVIKAIKGDFVEKFSCDVASLRRLVRLALLFYPTLERVADPAGILDTIEEGTLKELNLVKEADGQEILKEVCSRGAGLIEPSKLYFPKIYRELSGPRIMVSEFIPGKTFDELLDTGTLAYGRLLDLFRVHGFCLFCVGTFHGDIHPGNIIDHDGRITFLDTGAISTVGTGMRRGLFGFFERLCVYDYDGAAASLHAMSGQRLDNGAYRRYLSRFMELYSDFAGTTVSQKSLTRTMMETIRLAVKSGMIFEKGMYPIIKSMMYLDGMVLRCKPDAVLMEDIRDFVGEFRKYV